MGTTPRWQLQWQPGMTADTTSQHHQLAYEPLLVGGNGGVDDEWQDTQGGADRWQGAQHEWQGVENKYQGVEDMVHAVASGGVMLDIMSSIKAEIKPKIE